MKKQMTVIVTDSTADIPTKERNELNIVVVPAVLTLDGETYQDGVDLSRIDFYRRLPNLTSPPTTAAPSIATFESTYERILQSGVERILSIHLPSTLSAMIDIATQATKSFGDRIHIFDSGQVSLAMGFQVIESAITALQEAPFEAILETANRVRENVKLIALIDTLEFLKRSGRIGWLTAGLGNLLRIKIVLELVDGVVNRLGQVRTRTKATEQLRNIARGWGKLDRLAIAHSDCVDSANAFADTIRNLCHRPPMIIDVTTAIGAHIGPGALGVIGLKQTA
jgi:DegV family protein with EDD domain